MREHLRNVGDAAYSKDHALIMPGCTTARPKTTYDSRKQRKPALGGKQ